MTEDDFLSYEPIKNPFYRNGWPSPFEDTLAEYMFQPHGEELELVDGYDPTNIWTMTEEDEVLRLSSGKLMVNRIGYFVTEIPCHENINIVLD